MSFIGKGLVSLMRNVPGRLHANQSRFYKGYKSDFFKLRTQARTQGRLAFIAWNFLVCLRSVVRHRTTNDNGGMLPAPFSMRLGLPKVIAVVVPFLYFGATISKEGAAFLEEYDIFVPEDDD